MEITETKVFLVGEEKLKAFVSIVLDRCFMINDIKVIQGREGLFISMPSRRKKNGDFKDVAHPLNNETRRWLEDTILTEYDACLRASRGEEPAAEPNPHSTMSTERGAGTSEPERAGATESAEEPSLASKDTTPEARDESQEQSGDRLDEVQREHLSDSYWSVT